MVLTTWLHLGCIWDKSLPYPRIGVCFFFVFRYWKLSYCNHTVSQRVDRTIAHYVPKIRHLVFSKFTFGNFQTKPFFPNCFHQFLNMFNMLLKCLQKNQNIIDVVHAKTIKVSIPDDPCKNSLEYSWSAFITKRHRSPLSMAILHNKSSFVPIFYFALLVWSKMANWYQVMRTIYNP